MEQHSLDNSVVKADHGVPRRLTKKEEEGLAKNIPEAFKILKEEDKSIIDHALNFKGSDLNTVTQFPFETVDNTSLCQEVYDMLRDITFASTVVEKKKKAAEFANLIEKIYND